MKKMALMVALVTVSVGLELKGSVVNLYDPSNANWHYVGGGAVRQVFTVPSGYECTKFEFGASEGSQVSSELIYVQLYGSASNTDPLATGFATVSSVGSSYGWGWIAVDGLNLPAGTYSAQLFTNSSNSNIVQSLYVLKSVNYTYPGAYGATNWQDVSPEVLLSPAGEFWTRMTLETVPEPVTLTLLAVGGWLVRRKS